jgi:hypothetical protein
MCEALKCFHCFIILPSFDTLVRGDSSTSSTGQAGKRLKGRGTEKKLLA